MSPHPSASELVRWLEDDGSDATDAHLHACARCRDHLAQLRGLASFVHTAATDAQARGGAPHRVPTPLDDLEPELARRTGALLRRPHRGRRRPWASPWMALAAALLLLTVWIAWPRATGARFDAAVALGDDAGVVRGGGDAPVHFVLDLPDAVHVAILTVGDDGFVLPLYPDPNPLLGRLGLPDPLGPATDLRLPPEPELDFDLGALPPERTFVVIGSRRPLDAAAIGQFATDLHDALTNAPADPSGALDAAVTRLRSAGFEAARCRLP